MAKKEVEIQVGGRILGFSEVSNGLYRFIIEPPATELKSEFNLGKSQEGMIKLIGTDEFVLIESEKLSLNDEFMKHKPQCDSQINGKRLITEAINSKVQNFYHPRYDPSFSVQQNGVCYVPGKMPAVGKSYKWWKEVAKNYSPKHNSHLMTRLERGAFLGWLIKTLVNDGAPIELAWNYVCSNSKRLGHYLDSPYAKNTFEPTGSRGIFGIYDLGNTYKVLAEENESEGFLVTGGAYFHNSAIYPLADTEFNIEYDYPHSEGVGLIVLSE